ncbi:MAG: circadian clock KaiB family protein [Geitlerinemataceae cyanobacterium]
MSLSQVVLPQLFKGIALLTPGGDFFYCIDVHKRSRWHVNLCTSIQESLGLSEPPHFLVPFYTATIDRCLDPHTQKVTVFAEAFPPLFQYRVLLNAVFGTDNSVWQPAIDIPEWCNPLGLSGYRDSFPQLWEEHDLVVPVKLAELPDTPDRMLNDRFVPKTLEGDLEPPELDGYILHLFIKGQNAAIEQSLLNLYQFLDRSLDRPYTLKVIDVLKHPDRAEAERISATPTLIRVSPTPVQRIVGALDNPSQILSLLESRRTL